MSRDRYHGDELILTLYTELRKLADSRLRRFPGQTLQPTELVHEVYVKLNKRGDTCWNSTGHFFGAAARAMRDVLVDHVREKTAVRRGGDMQRVDMTISLIDDDQETRSSEELLSLNQTLETLRIDHPEHAEIVLLHWFTGLTFKDISEIQGVTTRTIERRWRFARAWMREFLTDRNPSAA